MKIRKTLHVLTCLIIVLTFGIPFTNIAQGKKIDAQAKLDATEDANQDVNKTLWFSTGCILSGLVFTTPYIGYYSCLLPPIGIAGTYFYQPNPSIERFIGKSPEYVSTYTSTYKTKRGKIQANMSATGCITGGAVVGGTLLGIGIALLNDIEQSTD